MAKRPWFSVYAGEYRREFAAAIKLSGMSTSEVFRQAMLKWIDSCPGLRVRINRQMRISPKGWKAIQKQRRAVAKDKEALRAPFESGE